MPDLPTFLYARVMEDAKLHWPTAARIRIEKSVRSRLLHLQVHNSFTAIYGHGATGSRNERWCVGCGYTLDRYPVTPDVDDCPVLRADAEVYDTHFDYNPSWRPKEGLPSD